MFAGREDAVVSRGKKVGSFVDGVRQHGKLFVCLFLLLH